MIRISSLKSAAAVFVAVVLSFANRGDAHPGHGNSNATEIEHYLTEPIHLAFLLVAALFVLMVSALVSRKVNLRVTTSKSRTATPKK